MLVPVFMRFPVAVTILLLQSFSGGTCLFSVYNMSRAIHNYILERYTPEPDMSTPSLIRRHGYPVETHFILTEDSYILEVHRIPHGRINNATNSTKYPVIVQHGNFQSSADWVLNSPAEESLGFFLADQGYDVWLGNQRGNGYSDRHTLLSSSNFWNFSFHEIGTYDLPAMLDYVTRVSEKKKAHFVGFSMGTAMFFAGLAKRPEYNDKIGIGIALGPSTFQEHFFNGWTKVLAPFVWAIQLFHTFTGDMPVLPLFIANLLHKVLPIICHPNVDLFGICMSVVQIGFGQDKGKITKERIHTVAKVSPCSSSMKAFLHELQLMGTNRFCEFDYGTDKNLIMYGKKHPPDYNLTQVSAKIALLVGPNDYLAHREDARTLASKLPNLVDFHFVPYDAFTHLDFCYAEDVSSLVYNHVRNLLNLYDGS